MAGLSLSVVQSFHQFSGPLNTGVTDTQNIFHFIKQSQVLKACHVAGKRASDISYRNIFKSEVFSVKYSNDLLWRQNFRKIYMVLEDVGAAQGRYYGAHRSMLLYL